MTTPDKLSSRKLTLVELAEFLKNGSQFCKILIALNYRLEREGIF